MSAPGSPAADGAGPDSGSALADTGTRRIASAADPAAAVTPGDPLVQLEDVWRTYDVGGRALHALAEIDEEIGAGEHVAIMGPSGSGKSTLLNILGCLDRPTRGSYRLAGRPVTDLGERELAEIRRHAVGFVFQSFHLVPRLSARQNVELPMMFAGIPRGRRLERADGLLADVGMADRASHRPDQLSGGERQRVAIARSLAMGPRMLLADEPTGNLDSRSGRRVLDLLEELQGQGITLLVVTHDPGVARRADRVITLVDGRIVSRIRGDELGEVNPYIAAAEEQAERQQADEEAGRLRAETGTGTAGTEQEAGGAGAHGPEDEP